jgi:hypothetical protein
MKHNMKLKTREIDALDLEELEALEQLWTERYEEEYLEEQEE